VALCADAGQVYGRSDCVESLRDRHVRPGGAWAMRLRQLRGTGLQVVVVGFDQWAGLVRAGSVAGQVRMPRVVPSLYSRIESQCTILALRSCS
jgi:hypothetical protein